MNASNPLFCEMTTLIGLRLDELESAESAARLDSLLLESDDACQLYVQLADLHASLTWEAVPAASEMRAYAGALVPAPVAERRQALGLPLRGTFSRAMHSINRPAFWSILCAGLLFAGYFVAISWNMLATDRARRDSDVLAAGISTGVVATVEGDADVAWSKAPQSDDARIDEAAPERSVHAGEPLEIASGIAELKLKQGATLFIEGPAEWTIDGDNRATLNQGRLIARVPEAALGFTLDTPAAQIVDLGTEFAVEVGAAGTAEVHVTKGEINVRALAGAGQKGPGALHAGQGARISTAGATVESTPTLPGKFQPLVDAGKKASVAQAAKRAVATRLIDFSRRGVAKGSSQIGPEYPAKNAIDGKPESCFHTDNDKTPWWQVDLGRSETIAAVVIYSVPGTRLGRCRDIYIKILAEDGQTVVAASPLLNPKNILSGGEEDWWKGPMQLAFEPVRTLPDPVVGRFVRVERVPCKVDGSDNDRMVLTLSEVQVFEAATDSKPAAPAREGSK